MNHTSLLHLVSLVSAGLLSAQQDPPQTPESPKLTALVQQLRAREASLKSLQMRVETRGAYPGGARLETAGRIRVLGGTHFDFALECSFRGGPAAGGVASRVRGVLTPTGFWRFEDGPVAGPTYIEMSPSLVAELQRAQAALATEAKAKGRPAQALPGPLDTKLEAPLGSATLLALDRFFDLSLQPGQMELDGVPCVLLAGAWRGATMGAEARKALQELDDGAVRARGASRCEVWLRASDKIPLRIAQYRSAAAGEKGEKQEELALEIRIRDLVLDAELDRESFVLKAPGDQVFVDALEHRPTRAQIDRLRDEYAALQERQKDKPGGK